MKYTVETVAKALDTAADIVAARGLAHHQYEAPSGAVCARAAIRIAVFGRIPWFAGNGSAAETLYYAVCRRLADTTYRPIETWSDSHTQTEVVAGLRRAARQARDAEGGGRHA